LGEPIRNLKFRLARRTTRFRMAVVPGRASLNMGR